MGKCITLSSDPGRENIGEALCIANEEKEMLANLSIDNFLHITPDHEYSHFLHMQVQSAFSFFCPDSEKSHPILASSWGFKFKILLPSEVWSLGTDNVSEAWFLESTSLSAVSSDPETQQL